MQQFNLEGYLNRRFTAVVQYIMNHECTVERTTPLHQPSLADEQWWSIVILVSMLRVYKAREREREKERERESYIGYNIISRN